MIKVEKIKEGSTLKERARNALFLYIRQLHQIQQTKLPSEDSLAKIFGVSRITIRGALNELDAQGYIFRRHGKGTFINAEALKVKVQFNPVRQFNDIIRQSGYVPSIRIIALNQISASSDIANALNISEGDEVILAQKIFYADQQPACFCVDYFPMAILSSAEDLADYHRYEESIFDFLQAKTGRTIAWDRIEISSVTNQNNDELTHYFQCEQQTRAFLLCQGINYDTDDRPLLYAFEYINTDLIKYNMIRQKSFTFSER